MEVKPMAARFHKRHYQAIAEVIQNLVLSDDELNASGLAEVERVRQAIASDFATMLKADNGAFQRGRFMGACEPGANVRARSPKGVTVIASLEPAALHDAIADAVGEPNTKSRRTFDTHCPRCHKQGEVFAYEKFPPVVHCGDCLMNEVAITEMLVIERAE